MEQQNGQSGPNDSASRNVVIRLIRH